LQKESKYVNDFNAKLVLIDGIISLHRAEFVGRGTLADRKQRLNATLRKIIRLAEIFNIAVVITNRVQSSPDTFFGDPTKAAVDNKWLLIDEFNRANMNKAFGELFLAIEYGKITLRPTESKRYEKDTIEIPQNFRMICTMNDFDKNLLLTELSYGLISRFAFVPITPDIQREPIVVERRVKSLLGNDDSYENCIEQIKLYFEFINHVRGQRNIGVRTSIDIAKYIISATKDGNNYDDNYKRVSLNNALCDYVLPQFDRLDGKTIDAVLTHANSDLAGEAFNPLREELQRASSRLQKAAGWLTNEDGI
jgi:hypothetical protein